LSKVLVLGEQDSVLAAGASEDFPVQRTATIFDDCNHVVPANLSAITTP
jgi:hypothetical protein